MNQTQWSVFIEGDGKVHVVELATGVRKIKGLGVLDAFETFSKIKIGEEVLVGQKILTRVPLRLPELSKGMLRRAQTISAKDAGFMTSRLEPPLPPAYRSFHLWFRASGAVMMLTPGVTLRCGHQTG